MKRVIDWQASLGVNRFAVFPPEQSQVQPAKDDLAQRFCRHPHYALFADYASRLCYVLSQGVHSAQVAVLYPNSRLRKTRGLLPACFADL